MKLNSFIPICAYCKKICDRYGVWKKIDSIMDDHSESDFTHGICPDCAKKLYPVLYEEILKEKG